MSDYSAGISTEQTVIACRPADLGPTLRHLRMARSLKIAAVAEQIGVSPAYISAAERRRHPVSLAVATRYTAHLGCEIWLHLRTADAGCSARLEHAGSLLAAARLRTNQPARFVAQQAGTATARLEAVEDEGRTPHLPWLAKTCKALNITPTLLLAHEPPLATPRQLQADVVRLYLSTTQLGVTRHRILDTGRNRTGL